MSNNNVDRQVADKMEKLDTLAGGIVYGKEDAWDKLQAMMDKKSARVIALSYWWAAAAVLLLFAGSIAWYHSNTKEVAVQTSLLQQQPLVSATDMAPTHNIAKTEVKPATQHNIVLTRKPVQPHDNIVEDTGIKVTTSAHEVLPSIEQQTEPVSASSLPLIKDMKVVHLNDIENGKAQQAVLPQGYTGIAINKIKVVHLNDLSASKSRKEKEEKELEKLSKVVFEKSVETTHEKNKDPFRISFKNRHNTQN